MNLTVPHYDPAGRRPRRTTIDPSWLADGDIGFHAATEDVVYGDERGTEQTLALILDRLVERLPSPDREAVELVAMSGLSYRDAGNVLGCDKKTAWRYVRRGLESLRATLTSTPWIADLLVGRVPLDQAPVGTPYAPFDHVLARPLRAEEDTDGEAEGEGHGPGDTRQA